MVEFQSVKKSSSNSKYFEKTYGNNEYLTRRKKRLKINNFEKTNSVFVKIFKLSMNRVDYFQNILRQTQYFTTPLNSLISLKNEKQ